MLRNCDSDVNQVRAELSASLFVRAPVANIPEMRGRDAIPQQIVGAAPETKTREWRPDNRSRINVFVDLDRGNAAPVPGEKQRIGTLALAEVAVAELSDIAASDGVTMVTPGERLIFSEPVPSTAFSNEPKRGIPLPK
jgi:hypothetical protein